MNPLDGADLELDEAHWPPQDHVLPWLIHPGPMLDSGSHGISPPAEVVLGDGISTVTARRRASDAQKHLAELSVASVIAQIEKPAFVFIDESGQSSKDRRKAIRSQAKRYAIAERSKRPREIRFVNLQGAKDQSLSPTRDHDATTSADRKSESPKAIVKAKARRPIILPDLPAKGYEAARIAFGFDVFLLSGLASVHIGKGVALDLHDAKLGDWLVGFQESSYLDHVPALFNQSPLLQSVVNCTMAQYRRAISSGAKMSEATVFRLYGKALQELQFALNDDERRLQPDVLLATAVLQLFELLQNETCGRWSYHTLGLMHLFQMRDPSTLTATELSLLASQLGPLINECFLRQIDCFFEEPRWANVILRLQRNNTLITSLLVAQAKLPRFMRIARDHVLRDTVPNPDPRERTAALAEMHAVKDFSYRWEQSLEARRQVNDSVLNLHELPCAVWALQINMNRIIVSLAPLAADARAIEDETQRLSDRVLEWWHSSARIDGERGDRLFTFPIPSAQIARATKEMWRGAVEGRLGYINAEWGVVDRRIFEGWTRLCRSKAPTRKYKYVEQAR